LATASSWEIALGEIKYQVNKIKNF